MRLNSFFNIQKENLPGADDWVDILLGPLNSILYNLWIAVSGNLSIGDNVIGQVTQIQFSTGNTYISNGTFSPIRIPWEPAKKANPRAIMVGKVEKPSNQPPQTATVQVPTWSYDFQSQSISIAYVAGLADNSNYTITLVIL